jgi:hypothetical protein
MVDGVKELGVSASPTVGMTAKGMPKQLEIDSVVKSVMILGPQA